MRRIYKYIGSADGDKQVIIDKRDYRLLLRVARAVEKYYASNGQSGGADLWDALDALDKSRKPRGSD